MQREPIYSAVFAKFAALTVGGSPAFAFATRRGETWDQSPPDQQPALCMSQLSETANYRKGLPTIWRCSIQLLLYVSTQALDNQEQIPSSLLNPLLDAIEAALTIDDLSNNACTLGGLVSHCAIEGPIEIVEGTLGNNAIAAVPIFFLTSP